jgi:tagatose-6-phosphate ketose/aldose isomerase
MNTPDAYPEVEADFPGLTAAELAAAGAAWTAREIAQQPLVWLQVAQLVERERARLDGFLAPLLAERTLRIVLSGAGTSAFVGDCLAPALGPRLRRRVDSIATTDLVSGPRLRFERGTPMLLVSFARSGNSPESMAAVDLAERLVDAPHHLVITCNGAGALAVQARRLRSACVLVLPDATNDRGFAMTSSFSSMLLAASLAFGLIGQDRPPQLARAGRSVLAAAHPLAERLSARRFERIVFLGSNELRGLAAEAALKLLELSDGRTLALAESVLGFRHGPKTVINDRTLVVVLLSNDRYTRAYDLDLLDELRRDGRAGCVLALGTSGGTHGERERLDIPGMAAGSDLEIALLDVLFAQVLALRQSLTLGVTPDRPNPAGLVNRVVQGVTIHPWQDDPADVPRR